MNARDLVLFFCDLWKEKYGRSYPVNFARDGHIFKALLEDYSAIELQAHIRFYLTEFDDSFVRQNGHTVPLFRTALPKLMAHEISKAKTQVDQGSDDFKRLETAREKLK